MIDGLSQSTELALGLGGLLVMVAGGLRWARPKWRQFKNDALGARDALVGREAIIDRASGREVAPAIPGIGHRMATVEQVLVTLVDNEHRLSAAEDAISSLRADVTRLDAAYVERIVTKAESASAWRAVEAAIDATPDHIDVKPDDA